MNRIDKAIAAYEKLILAQRHHFSASKIAASPLPKHKQKYFDDLQTQTLVTVRNARESFISKMSKLTVIENAQFHELARAVK